MKRTRLRSYSSRRRDRDRDYGAARAEACDRAQGRCEAAWSERCPGRGSEAHHVAGRLGDDPHDPEWLLWVCRPCHDLIHACPLQARERGWMRSRLGKVGQFTGRARP